MPPTYLDFELAIGAGQGREYPIAVLRSPAGEARETMRFPHDWSELESGLDILQGGVAGSATQRRGLASSPSQPVRDFGQALFDALFTGSVRTVYDLSRQAARSESKGLRIRLRIQAPEIARIPWEYLYDRREAEYCCLSHKTPLVRYPELPQATQPLAVAFPLRILGMAASPTDLPALDIDQEKRRIELAIERLSAAGLVELHWLPGQTRRDLQAALRAGPWHIFHFSGHGAYNPAIGQGQLVFCDDGGQSRAMPAIDVGRLLANHNTLRLAWLNACKGAYSGQSIFSSAASILMRSGIPAVVAMQHEIGDEAAVELSRTFYQALADGYPVDAALAEARVAVASEISDSVEWGIPALYMRAPDGMLFDLAGQTSSTPTAAAATASTGPAGMPFPPASVQPLVNGQPQQPAPAVGTPQPAGRKRRVLWLAAGLALLVIAALALAAGPLGGLLRPQQTITRVTPGRPTAAPQPINQMADPALSPPAATLQLPSMPEQITSALSPAEAEQPDAAAPAVVPPALVPRPLHTPLPLSSRAITPTSAANVQQLQLIDESSSQTAWSPDGAYLALLSGAVHLYDGETFQPVRRLGQGENIRDFAFLPDGVTLATAGDAVKVWRADTGGELQVLPNYGDVERIAASPDGRTLALGIGQAVKLIAWQSGAELATLTTGSTDSNLAFSPDGRWLATGGGMAGTELITFALPAGDPGPAMKGHSNWIRWVTYSADGSVLASASVDGTVKLWDPGSGRLLATLEGHEGQVTAVALSPDGSVAASTSFDLTVRLWDTATARLLNTLTGQTAWGKTIAFSPDGALLASSDFRSGVRIWGSTTAEEPAAVLPARRVIPERLPLSSQAISPSTVGQLTVLATAEPARVQQVVFAPDSLTLVAAAGRVLTFGAPSLLPQSPTLPDARAVAYSPDGNMLVSTYDDPRVSIWSVFDGEELRTLTASTATVEAVAFSPDGAYLITTGDALRLWGLDR